MEAGEERQRLFEEMTERLEQRYQETDNFITSQILTKCPVLKALVSAVLMYVYT